MKQKTVLNFVWTTASKSHEGQASTIDEALTILGQAGGAATMVEFYDPESGLALTIGVGANCSVVTFQESIDPPYYLSLGAQDATGVLEFCYRNEPTEYLARNAVSNDCARKALKWFFEHRTRPQLFEWERV